MRFSKTSVASLAAIATQAAAVNPNTRLWYTAPAVDWTDALPIGNGFIGAMIFGNPFEERMQINEDSVYSGGFRSRVNQDALEVLPEVRDLLASGDVADAQTMAKIGLTATPQSTRHYETLGEMMLEFVGTRNYNKNSYQRWLDLETAIAGVNFTVGQTSYRREMFASFPDKVIVHHITAEGGDQKLAFNVRVHRPFPGGNSASDKGYNLGGDTVYMIGGTQSNEPIIFGTGLTVKTDGTVRAIGESLVISNATEATLFLAAATSYRHEDPIAAIDETLNKAVEYSYDELRQRHLEDYQPLFKACTLELGGEGTTGSDLPTNKRVNATQAGGNDPGLVALQFQYGRYMLIGSSREGSLPANLQGIWCADWGTAWGSKYTVNIK